MDLSDALIGSGVLASTASHLWNRFPAGTKFACHPSLTLIVRSELSSITSTGCMVNINAGHRVYAGPVDVMVFVKTVGTPLLVTIAVVVNTLTGIQFVNT